MKIDLEKVMADEGNSLMDHIYNVYDCLICPSEVDAHIRSNMPKAKRNGEVLEEIIEKMIEGHIFSKFSDEIKEHIAKETEIGFDIILLIIKINGVYQKRIDFLYANRKKFKNESNYTRWFSESMQKYC